MKTTTVTNLALAAAFAGLMGGTAARLDAQPVSTHSTISANALLFAGTPRAGHHQAGPAQALVQGQE
jgi:hypothetical protein